MYDMQVRREALQRKLHTRAKITSMIINSVLLLAFSAAWYISLFVF